jgi:hypothetical protein
MNLYQFCNGVIGKKSFHILKKIADHDIVWLTEPATLRAPCEYRGPGRGFFFFASFILNSSPKCHISDMGGQL